MVTAGWRGRKVILSGGVVGMLLQLYDLLWYSATGLQEIGYVAVAPPTDSGAIPSADIVLTEYRKLWSLVNVD